MPIDRHTNRNIFLSFLRKKIKKPLYFDIIRSHKAFIYQKDAEMLTLQTSKNARQILSPTLHVQAAKSTLLPLNSAAVDFQKKIHGPTVVIGDNSHLIKGSLSSGTGDRFDAKAALKNFSGDFLLRAEMAVTLPSFHRPSQLGYYDQLERLGWVVNRFAPLVDGYGRVTEDERVVDGCVRDCILAAADDASCQSIVLFGADGGFTRAATYARRAGKDVFVCSWANTLHPALAAAAFAHISLEILQPLILRAYH